MFGAHHCMICVIDKWIKVPGLEQQQGSGKDGVKKLPPVL